MHESRSGFQGAWTPDPDWLSNGFFQTLLLEQWDEHWAPDRQQMQYKARGKELYMLKSDLALRFDPEFSAAAQDYASDNELFLRDFAAAWTRIMNADRFDGPTGNVCDKPSQGRAAEEAVVDSALRILVV